MRRITRRQLLLGSLGLAALPYPYARWYERHYPVVETVQTPVPHLPSALEGLRVVQLSDLHLSSLNGPDLMHRVVQQVQSLKPDLLLLTGDFVTDHERDAAPLAEILAALQPPLGSYASLGNHDYWTDAHTVTQSLRHKGIQVLIDQVVPLQHRGETLHLGGMDSAWGGRPDFSAVSQHLPRQQPLLLMAHEPDYADIVAAHGLPLTQLSGHSHAGQVRAPFFGDIIRVKWAKHYTMGAYTVGPVNLYVNRGIGCVNQPVRFLCPPEITLHLLKSVG